MSILVVNGRKLNSFALSLECAVHLSCQSERVSFVDLNIFSLPWSRRNRIQAEIISKYGIERNAHFFRTQANIIKAAREAASWCEAATGSDRPWERGALNGQLPLGRLVRSLIARSMGTSNFHLSDCAKSQVYDIAFKSIFSYLQTITAIEMSPRAFHLGLAHGGRDAYSAGAICAFRQHGIKTHLVESGGVPTRWSLFTTSPHYSPDFWTRLEKSDTEAFSKAQVFDWWSERLAGSDHFRTEEWGHTRQRDLLPRDLPAEYISFFTTSDFEIPVFEDFDIFPGEFSNQMQAFLALRRACERNNIHLVVRRHPNSIDRLGIDREMPMWERIQGLPGVTYLGPHEKVDSIALARGSRTVYTFKSSVGIEAIWLGVPAFALGPARWAWVSELRVWDEDKLESTVNDPKSANRDHAIRWANMMLKMDHPNSQFGNIHGNKAQYKSVAIRNSKASNYTDKLFVAVLMKLAQLVRKV